MGWKNESSSPFPTVYHVINQRTYEAWSFQKPGSQVSCKLNSSIWYSYSLTKYQDITKTKTKKQSIQRNKETNRKWREINKLLSYFSLLITCVTYTVKLQYLNWQLVLQLSYRKITISNIINVELQTFVVIALLKTFFTH